jgi:hypothetical protein
MAALLVIKWVLPAAMAGLLIAAVWCRTRQGKDFASRATSSDMAETLALVYFFFPMILSANDARGNFGLPLMLLGGALMIVTLPLFWDTFTRPQNRQ